MYNYQQQQHYRHLMGVSDPTDSDTSVFINEE